MSWNIAFLPYGPRWRAWRKVFYEHFHPNASRQYRPRELRAARQLLENLLRTPEQYRHHLRLSVASLFSDVDQRFMSSCSMTGQVIMGIAYGIEVAPHDDPYVSLAETALQAVESASTTGWTFDMLPFCGYTGDINDPALMRIIAQTSTFPGGFQVPVSKKRPQGWRLILMTWSTNHTRPSRTLLCARPVCF
jgi:hypothetical protein